MNKKTGIKLINDLKREMESDYDRNFIAFQLSLSRITSFSLATLYQLTIHHYPNARGMVQTNCACAQQLFIKVS